jgi:hypothetical protein
VLPFSKRPPPPDEYLLRSGDLEAVRQDPYSMRTPAPQSYAPASYPPPASQSYAPPPAFVRQAPQSAPYGFAQQQYGHQNDLSAPPPPHSLAPMAMTSDPMSSGRFSTTGASHTHSATMGGRDSKPSLKWGIMIALSGALLGGVLGLGMDARRQSARAAAAAEANAAAPAVVAAALPAAAPVQPVVVAPRTAPAPVALAAAPVANALVAPAVIPPAPVAAAPVVTAPPAPAPVVLAAAPAIVVPKGAAHPRAAVKPHGFLATKVTPPRAPEPKAEAPEPKQAKAETPKPEPKAAPRKDASTSDAMKILEAANKDTTNTL